MDIYDRRKVLARRIRKFGFPQVEKEIFANFPARVKRVFRTSVLRDLLICGEGQLLRTTRGFGRKSLSDLKISLNQFGLTTHMDPAVLDDLGIEYPYWDKKGGAR